MQKILTLTTKDWMTGISTGAHLDRGGIWSTAQGINPFVDPSYGTVNSGLLQTSSAASDITGDIADIPAAYVTEVTGSGTGKLYLWCDGTTRGSLWSIDISGDNSPIEVVEDFGGSPVFTTCGRGVFIYQTRGGTKYLYVVTKTNIGRWDLAGTYPTGWATNHWGSGGTGTGDSTDLQTTSTHPTHNFIDKVYIGNKDRLAEIYDNAGTATYIANTLDFPSNFTCTDLEDDGQYLVIGLTKNQGDNVIYAETRVLFWDTNSSSWQAEWKIPDTNLIALKRIGTLIYAVCGRGIWAFNYQQHPIKIRSLNTSDVPSYGFPVSANSFNEALIWGGSQKILTYGKVVSEAPGAFHEPYNLSASEAVTLIVPDARFGRLYVGSAASKLYRFNTTTGGATSLSAKTVYIPLGERHTIKRIEVTFGEPLTSGDSLNIDLQGDEDVAATDWGTISYATNGAKTRVMLPGTKANVDNLRMILNFNGGNVKIKQIDIYGERQVL